MKKLHSQSYARAGKVACTISAAALMLGVSDAATIGFNFQAHYCAAPSYSGAYVTATAFGIGTNGWESLIEMDTGYGCSPGPFTLNEIIDTTTSTSGLHPLSKGSLNVTWYAYVANVSGFGGYDRSPPNYTFGGNGFTPGNEQVYWGFLRDGVNFGPGSTAGDNNQPGWSVDITGLKSVFNNSPFVVETIGAGDSISSLTNVFIIDATTSTTQSVTYPNIPPISNVGDTAWPRGVGGGLSTGSGPVNTDHLMIIGNRAQHSAGSPAYNNASQVAGFIITDKPVVTMSPQPALVGPGDNVTLRAIAIGVPPLSLQWRKDGAPIPGANSLSYNIPSAASSANYDLVVTNLYGSATSQVASVTVDPLSVTQGPSFTPDSNPSGPPDDGAVLGATMIASSTDSLGTTRLGVAQFVATNLNQIVVSGTTTNLDSTQGTIMFWMRSAGTTGPGNNGAMIFDRLTAAGGLQIIQTDAGNIEFKSQNGYVDFQTARAVNDDNWHHVAITYDTSGAVLCFIDGQYDSVGVASSTWNWPAGQAIDLGLSRDSSWKAYDGQLDDVRIYNRQLTTLEVGSVYTNNAVVDPNALKLRLDFDASLIPGITVNWQLSGDVLQSADALTGPWTDVPLTPSSPYRIVPQATQKFYRYRHTPAAIITNPYDM